MPIDVLLTASNGDPLQRVGASNDGALHWAIDHPDEYPVVSRVDPYGDTTITHSHLDAFALEWRRVIDEATNDQQHAYALEVSDILEQARQIPGSAVLFIGD